MKIKTLSLIVLAFAGINCASIGLKAYRGPHSGKSKSYIPGDCVAFVSDAGIAYGLLVVASAPVLGSAYAIGSIAIFLDSLYDNLQGVPIDKSEPIAKEPVSGKE